MKMRFGRQTTGGISFFAFQDIITGTSGFLIVLTLFLALNLDEKLATDRPATTVAHRDDELKALQTQIESEKKKVADYQALPALDEDTLRRLVGQLKSSAADLDGLPLPGMSRAADATARERQLRAERERLLTRLEGMQVSIANGEALSAKLTQEVADLEAKILRLEDSRQRRRKGEHVLNLLPEADDSPKEPLLVLVQNSLLRFQRADGSPGGGSLEEFIAYLREVSPATHYVVLYFKPSGAAHFTMLTRHAREQGFEVGYDVIPEEMDVEFNNREATPTPPAKPKLP